MYLPSSTYPHSGECVTFNKSKTFANPGYVVHSICVNDQELVKIKKFISSSCSQKVKFDGGGMYLSVLPFSVTSTDPGKTFCSKYITEALQAADLRCLKGVDSRIVSPTKLYKILQRDNEKRQVMSTVEFKKSKILAFLGDVMYNRGGVGYTSVPSV